MVVEAYIEEKVDIEIVYKKLDEPIDNIFLVAFAESNDEEEKEENNYRVCKITKIEKKKVNKLRLFKIN